MKSKTSYFNVTIFKKNFTHFWPIWLLYLGYLTLMLPINIWLEATAEGYYTGVTQLARQNYIMNSVMQAALLPVPVFLFAVVIATAVFSYLYIGKNANMIHSLPVNRLELYLTNYLSGFLFMLVPEIIAFAASVLVCLANQITCIQYLFVWLLYIAGMTFFAYTLSVLMAMFTGQAFAVPVYFLITNYAYVGCLYAVNRIVGFISYGISDVWNPGASCVLSPLYYLIGNVSAQTLAEQGTDQVTGISFEGGRLIVGYAAVAVILLLIAYQLYKRRKIETAGDFISIGMLKPVFRWGVALLGGILLSLAATEMLDEAYRVNAFICILAGIVFSGFICFFGAEMLIQKNFRVFRRKRIIEWAGFTVLAIIFISLFKLDAFGIERKLPDQDEIETVFVYMDYPIQMQEEDFSTVLKLHRQAIEQKDDYLKQLKEEEHYYYTTFRYFLRDGTVFERRYPMPLTEEYLADKNSATSVILEWESQPENLKQQLLGIDYENIDFYSGYIDLYEEGGDGRQQSHNFDAAELEEIINAIVRDVDAGNFDDYLLYSINRGEAVTYYNGIALNYYNRGKIIDNWENYYSYRNYQKNLMSPEIFVAESTGIYINFGPDCTNLIDTLKRLGIVNDTQRLHTYEEYEQMISE